MNWCLIQNEILLFLRGVIYLFILTILFLILKLLLQKSQLYKQNIIFKM